MNPEQFVSYAEMLDRIRVRFPEISRTVDKDKANDTSKAWKVPGFKGKVSKAENGLLG